MYLSPRRTSKLIRTDDGSLTLRHPEVGEAYHSLDGADTETRFKFIEPSRLKERLETESVRLLDVGFGLGLNCRAALAVTASFPLQIDSLETETQALDRGLLLFPEDPLLLQLKATGQYQVETKRVDLHLGDVRQTIQHLQGPYDLIFHDPFSPNRNSECWTVDLFAHFFQRLKPDGALLTYSQSKMVRMALQEAGFIVQDTHAPSPHRGGTIALKQGEGLILESTPPFRDPTLSASGHDIRSQREAEVRALREKPRTS
ncbi:MnmC family methyltransferase [Kiritimatiellota bacterium B12222]|nr:MnmC family methyltransferase [Kiritimatiellota bacterium B12222]